MRFRCLSLACASLCCAPTAWANGRPSLLADYGRNAPRAALELEAGGSTHSGAHVLTCSLAGRLTVSASVDIALELPAVWLDAPALSSSRDGVFTGNPYLGLYHVDRDRDRSGYFRIGVGLALPASGVDDTSFGDADSSFVLAINGVVDPWLFETESLALVVPMRAEGRRGMRVLGVELVLAQRLNYLAGGTRIQLAPWAGIQLGNVVLGTRLQLTWPPFLGVAFLSLAPFVQAEFSDHGFLFTRFVLNLDEPYGVFGDGTGVWGAFIGGGARL